MYYRTCLLYLRIALAAGLQGAGCLWRDWREWRARPKTCQPVTTVFCLSATSVPPALQTLQHGTQLWLILWSMCSDSVNDGRHDPICRGHGPWYHWLRLLPQREEMANCMCYTIASSIMKSIQLSLRTRCNRDSNLPAHFFLSDPSIAFPSRITLPERR